MSNVDKPTNVLICVTDRYGIECLFRFYAYGLDEKYKEGRLNLSLYNDFQEEVIEDWMNGQLYGLEKFVGFLEYSGFPEENVRPEIKEFVWILFLFLNFEKIK